MGILEAGSILEWENSEKAREFVKQKGVEQFISLLKLHENRVDPPESLKWGEEIEFNMVEFNEKEQIVTPYTQSEEIFKKINDLEDYISNYNNNIKQGGWHYEYGSFMIESVPGVAYNLSLNSIPAIQKSLTYRRWKLETVLPQNVGGTTISNLPNLGASHYLEKEEPDSLDNRVTRSVFLDNSVITNHFRFQYLSKNIYKRRGAKVSILVPLKVDIATHSNKIWNNSVEKDSINRYELQALSEKNPNPVKDNIYMDTMAFGMGMSCVQSTYMSANLDDARYLYDQFTVLAPFWLSMTASTPFFRGLLASTDVRWDALSQSVDCRTSEEMSFIEKSRYASVSFYISKESPLSDHLEEFNDLSLPINENVYSQLIKSGIDPIMAKHVAYLYMRDPMVIFKESLIEGTSLFKTHFDNILTTNWNSVRFKPPPSFDDSKSEIGWRVEFRTSELQISDFENAAFLCLITVLTQLIMKERLELYIPISKSDENFNSSHKENSILTERFWFRNDITSGTTDHSYREMTLEEIMISRDANGNAKGLMTRCEDYILSEYKAGNCSREARETAQKYFDFISLRLRGLVDTNATFFRKLINAHPDYKHDSIIPESAAYDIIQIAHRVGSLSMQIPEIYGPFIYNFNPGFESYFSHPHLSTNKIGQSSSNLYETNEFIHSSTLETVVSSSDLEIHTTSNLQRYLFSCCQKNKNCDEYLASRVVIKPDENFSTITSFATFKSNYEQNLDSLLKDYNNLDLDTNNNTLSTPPPLLPRLHDFVISEDFTKSWMMRKWLTEPDNSTFHSYTDYENDCDVRSEGSKTLCPSESTNDIEYINTVNELSA